MSELTYKCAGDYLIPDLAIKAQVEEIVLAELVYE